MACDLLSYAPSRAEIHRSLMRRRETTAEDLASLDRQISAFYAEDERASEPADPTTCTHEHKEHSL